jgi:poly-gamma-glutamate synthesis protein (capsule biosynthesis protein)
LNSGGQDLVNYLELPCISDKMNLTKNIALIFFILLLFSCQTIRSPSKQEDISEQKEDYLTIIAAGDNLIHDRIFQSVFINGIYDFNPIYTEVQPFIEKADIAFINQEVLLAGSQFGFSGYPRFNAPQELGNALAGIGFDIINHANNHAMDKGEKAVLATMDFWDTFPEIYCLGIHRSTQDRDKPVIIEKNNIKTGFLSYTYGTNSLPIPKEKPYLVSLINTDVMAEEIDRLRPLCDYLVVSMHWGTEYESEPDNMQLKLSQFLADHNVDLVIGHHPHVLQKFSSIPRKDGKIMLCYYSLGNFLSAQTTAATLLGGFMYLRLKKTQSGISVEETGIIPTVTHYENGFTAFKIYPLFQYTDELAKKHWKNNKVMEIGFDYFNTFAGKLFESAILLKNPFDMNN